MYKNAFADFLKNDIHVKKLTTSSDTRLDKLSSETAG